MFFDVGNSASPGARTFRFAPSVFNDSQQFGRGRIQKSKWEEHFSVHNYKKRTPLRRGSTHDMTSSPSPMRDQQGRMNADAEFTIERSPSFEVEYAAGSKGCINEEREFVREPQLEDDRLRQDEPLPPVEMTPQTETEPTLSISREDLRNVQRFARDIRSKRQAGIQKRITDSFYSDGTDKSLAVDVPREQNIDDTFSQLVLGIVTETPTTEVHNDESVLDLLGLSHLENKRRKKKSKKVVSNSSQEPVTDDLRSIMKQSPILTPKGPQPFLFHSPMLRLPSTSPAKSTSSVVESHVLSLKDIDVFANDPELAQTSVDVPVEPVNSVHVVQPEVVALDQLSTQETGVQTATTHDNNNQLERRPADEPIEPVYFRQVVEQEMSSLQEAHSAKPDSEAMLYDRIGAIISNQLVPDYSSFASHLHFLLRSGEEDMRYGIESNENLRRENIQNLFEERRWSILDGERKKARVTEPKIESTVQEVTPQNYVTPIQSDDLKTAVSQAANVLMVKTAEDRQLQLSALSRMIADAFNDVTRDSITQQASDGQELNLSIAKLVKESTAAAIQETIQNSPPRLNLSRLREDIGAIVRESTSLAAQRTADEPDEQTITDLVRSAIEDGFGELVPASSSSPLPPSIREKIIGTAKTTAESLRKDADQRSKSELAERAAQLQEAVEQASFAAVEEALRQLPPQPTIHDVDVIVFEASKAAVENSESLRSLRLTPDESTIKAKRDDVVEMVRRAAADTAKELIRRREEEDRQLNEIHNDAISRMPELVVAEVAQSIPTVSIRREVAGRRTDPDFIAVAQTERRSSMESVVCGDAFDDSPERDQIRDVETTADEISASMSQPQDLEEDEVGLELPVSMLPRKESPQGTPRRDTLITEECFDSLLPKVSPQQASGRYALLAHFHKYRNITPSKGTAALQKSAELLSKSVGVDSPSSARFLSFHQPSVFEDVATSQSCHNFSIVTELTTDVDFDTNPQFPSPRAGEWEPDALPVPEPHTIQTMDAPEPPTVWSPVRELEISVEKEPMDHKEVGVGSDVAVPIQPQRNSVASGTDSPSLPPLQFRDGEGNLNKLRAQLEKLRQKR